MATTVRTAAAIHNTCRVIQPRPETATARTRSRKSSIIITPCLVPVSPSCQAYLRGLSLRSQNRGFDVGLATTSLPLQQDLRSYDDEVDHTPSCSRNSCNTLQPTRIHQCQTRNSHAPNCGMHVPLE